MLSATAYRAILFAFCVMAISSHCAAKEWSEREVYTQFKKLIERLDNCHVVFATRESQGFTGAEGAAFETRFFDLWLSGDYAQIREISFEPDDTKKWWLAADLDAVSSPMVSDVLDSVPGRKVCVRPLGNPRWADSRLLMRPNVPYPSLYTISNGWKQFPVFILPHVELDRHWKLPEHKGNWPIVNFVAEQPFENWRIIGVERLNSKQTVKVEVRRQDFIPIPLAKHDGKLEFAVAWHVWFSVDEGFFPIALKHAAVMRYMGKQIPVERESGLPTFTEYSATDMFKLSDDVWYPRTGKQETYFSTSAEAKGPDFDKVIDDFLAHGRYIHKKDYERNSSRLWHVIDMELIEPTTDLWFDAPQGACVHDLDAKTRHIAGVSRDESNKLLGIVEGGADIPPDNDRGTWQWALLGLNAIVACILAKYVIARRFKSS